MGTRGRTLTRALWVCIAAYAGADVSFLLAGLYPGHVPVVVSVALHIFPPLVFALLHGATLYGWRGACMFAGLSVLVGNLFENLSIRTGFPFGRYSFTERMGPKILQVPVLLGLAYVGMGYLSWTVASAMLRARRDRLAGWRVATLPLLATVVMTSWDVAMDPIWSTVGRLWIWQEGGGYFGVPASNYFGWLLTNYVIYQLFALWLMGWGGASDSAIGFENGAGVENLSKGYLRVALIFYVVTAVGNLLLTIPRPRHPVVSDAAGAAWRVSDITAACAVASVLLMGAFAISAWVRVAERSRESESSPSA
ncbi:MAG: carotenoid biosynthesis protein [Candidatus Acidiferrum sp.]